MTRETEEQARADKRVIESHLFRLALPDNLAIREMAFGVDRHLTPTWHIHFLLHDGNWQEESPRAFTSNFATALFIANHRGELQRVPVVHFETLTGFNEIVEWYFH